MSLIPYESFQAVFTAGVCITYIQVDHESNLDALRIGLKASHAHHIEAIEGANHLLQNCMTGAVTEYRTIEETISPKVLETVVSWLSAL